MPIFFKKDKQGKPIVKSNKKFSKRPYGNWGSATNVIAGPVPNEYKTPFPGNMRYFVQYDADYNIIEGTLTASVTPVGGTVYELFANDLIALPLEAVEDSGAIADDPEEVVAVELGMSQQYAQHGLRTMKKGRKTIIITD
jgi:hypothetical protein